MAPSVRVLLLFSIFLTLSIAFGLDKSYLLRSELAALEPVTNVTDNKTSNLTKGQNLKQATKACLEKNEAVDYDGAEDEYRGWYDVQGCGRCDEYCRWVGASGSGGDPRLRIVYKESFWSCRLAGTSDSYSPRGYFGSKFQHRKCRYESQSGFGKDCIGKSRPAEPKTFFKDDRFRGWYDVQGCGRCQDYCMWYGNFAQDKSGGDPRTAMTIYSEDDGEPQTYWGCKLAGKNGEMTVPNFFPTWELEPCNNYSGVANFEDCDCSCYCGRAIPTTMFGQRTCECKGSYWGACSDNPLRRLEPPYTEMYGKCCERYHDVATCAKQDENSGASLVFDPWTPTILVGRQTSSSIATLKLISEDVVVFVAPHGQVDKMMFFICGNNSRQVAPWIGKTVLRFAGFKRKTTGQWEGDCEDEERYNKSEQPLFEKFVVGRSFSDR